MSITDTPPPVDPDGIAPPLDPGSLVKPERLAQRWDCSRAFIYKCMANGLPSVTIGRARRIRLADADAWLAEQSGGGLSV